MYEGEERRQNLPWHLNQKTVLAVIASILINSASFIWYGAKLDSQVQSTKNDVLDLKAWREKADAQREQIQITLTSVDQKLSDQGNLLNHLTDLLEKNIYNKQGIR